MIAASSQWQLQYEISLIEVVALLALFALVLAAAFIYRGKLSAARGHQGESGHGTLMAVKIHVSQFEVGAVPRYEAHIKAHGGKHEGRIIRSTHVPDWLLDDYVLDGPLHLTEKKVNLRASKEERRHAAYKIRTCGYVFTLNEPFPVEWHCERPGEIAWRTVALRDSPQE